MKNCILRFLFLYILNGQDIIKHPGYKSTIEEHDIALLQMTKAIRFTSNIQPAKLHMDLRDEHRDVNLIVTGWGRTEGNCCNENIPFYSEAIRVFFFSSFQTFFCVKKKRLKSPMSYLRRRL